MLYIAEVQLPAAALAGTRIAGRLSDRSRHAAAVPAGPLYGVPLIDLSAPPRRDHHDRMLAWPAQSERLLRDGGEVDQQRHGRPEFR